MKSAHFLVSFQYENSAKDGFIRPNFSKLLEASDKGTHDAEVDINPFPQRNGKIFLTALRNGIAVYKGDIVYSEFLKKSVQVTGIHIDEDGEVFFYCAYGNKVAVNTCMQDALLSSKDN